MYACRRSHCTSLKLSHTLCSLIYRKLIFLWVVSPDLHVSALHFPHMLPVCYILKRPAHLLPVQKRDWPDLFERRCFLSFSSRFFFPVRHSPLFLSLWVSDPNSIQFQTSIGFLSGTTMCLISQNNSERLAGRISSPSHLPSRAAASPFYANAHVKIYFGFVAAICFAMKAVSELIWVLLSFLI